MAASAPNFAPGADHLCGDSGYVRAALVAERATGSSLAAFSDEHFLRPLGMTSTCWRQEPGRVVPGLARACRRDEA